MLLAKISLLCGVATASEKYLIDGVRGRELNLRMGLACFRSNHRC